MPKVNGFGQAAIFTALDLGKLYSKVENPYHRLFLDIAGYTGAPFSAIVQLRVSDVYADIGVPGHRQPHEDITFRRPRRRRSGKQKISTYRVPVHWSLHNSLATFLPLLLPGGWLFPGQKNGEHITWSTADNFLRKALFRAGLEGKGYSTFSFRRTFCAELIAKGVGLLTVQELMGYRNADRLMPYFPVKPEDAVKAIRVIGSPRT